MNTSVYKELQIRILVSLLTDMIIDGNGRSISYEDDVIIVTNNSTGWTFKIMNGCDDMTSNVIIIRDNHYVGTVLNFNGTYDGFDLEKAMRGE